MTIKNGKKKDEITMRTTNKIQSEFRMRMAKKKEMKSEQDGKKKDVIRVRTAKTKVRSADMITLTCSS